MRLERGRRLWLVTGSLSQQKRLAEGKSDAFEKPCDGSAAMGFRSDGNDNDSDDASGANDDQYAVLNRVNGVLNKELDILLRGQQ